MSRQADEFLAGWIQRNIGADAPSPATLWDSLGDKLLEDAKVEGIWPLDLAIAFEAHPTFDPGSEV